MLLYFFGQRLAAFSSSFTCFANWSLTENQDQSNDSCLSSIWTVLKRKWSVICIMLQNMPLSSEPILWESEKQDWKVFWSYRVRKILQNRESFWHVAGKLAARDNFIGNGKEVSMDIRIPILIHIINQVKKTTTCLCHSIKKSFRTFFI